MFNHYYVTLHKCSIMQNYNDNVMPLLEDSFSPRHPHWML